MLWHLKISTNIISILFQEGPAEVCLSVPALFQASTVVQNSLQHSMTTI